MMGIAVVTADGCPSLPAAATTSSPTTRLEVVGGGNTPTAAVALIRRTCRASSWASSPRSAALGGNKRSRSVDAWYPGSPRACENPAALVPGLPLMADQYAAWVVGSNGSLPQKLA